MNISFNGTKQVFNPVGKEIESKQTNLKEDLQLLEELKPDWTKNKGFYDTQKGEYGIHTFNRDDQPVKKMIVKSNDDGDTLILVSKTNKDGNTEQATISNNELNAALKEPNDLKVPENYEGIVLDIASSILYHLKEKVVLPEKAQTFVDEISEASQKTKHHAITMWSMQF